MLHHASRCTHAHAAPLLSILQAAAGRAWVRTGPARLYHRTNAVKQNDVSQVVERGESSHNVWFDDSAALSRQGKQKFSIVSRVEERIPAYVQEPYYAKLGPCRNPVQPSLPSKSSLQSGKGTPTRSRPIVRYHAIRHINPNRLSLYDVSFVDPGLNPSSTYEDDPPWAEVMDSLDVPLPTIFAPCSFVCPCEVSSEPHSMNAFHQTLLRMISSGASLEFLLIYHKHYRSLNSTRSFNRILALAIRQNKFRIAQDLFDEMQDRGVYHNVESRKLRTRMLVQQGFWYEAWELESAQGEILLPIWLEFLDIPQRSTVRTMQIPREGMAPELLPAKLVPPSTHVARFRLLLRNFPKIDSGQLAAMPPRTVYAIVRWMLRMHYRQPALDITTLYFRQLPQTINSSLHNLCLRIIHLHMLPGWKRGLSAHYIARRTLNTFLGMHPSFRPNSTTLFLLLRTLRSSKYCGTLAHQVVEEFKTCWGSSVIDDMVQQRVASLAIKEGRSDIASSCLRALNQHRHVLDETSHPPRGTENRKLRGRLERLRKRREGAPHQQQQEVPRQGIT